MAKRIMPHAAGSTAPTRSIRIDSETWEKAKIRAAQENVTISRVLSLLTEGYARGMLDLPKIQLIYDKNK